jgi:hypothetical protein
MLELSPGKNSSLIGSTTSYFKDKMSFVLKDKSSLPEDIQKLLPKEVTEVSVLDHKISQYLFQGSLDEIKPALSSEALRAKKPALVLSPDGKTFALVFVENDEISCDSASKKGLYLKSVSLSPLQKGSLNENRYCWTY